MEELLEKIKESSLPYAQMAVSLIGVYVQGDSNAGILVPSLENLINLKLVSPTWAEIEEKIKLDNLLQQVIEKTKNA
jgi:hypothetical protein